MQNLPTHPTGNTLVAGNFFKFQPKNQIKKYHVEIEPQIPNNQMKLIFQIIGKLKKQFQENFGVFIVAGQTIYSPKVLDDALSYEVEDEGITYKLNIGQKGSLDEASDTEKLNFFGRFFKLLQKNLRYKMIGRKYFNNKMAKDFPQLRLEVWPGFITSVNNYGSEVLLNVDVNYKILRLDNVLQFFNENKGWSQDDFQNNLNGQTVMTSYNKRMYRISRIDYDKNPLIKFTITARKEGESDKEVTLKEYYQQRYHLTVSNDNQPLLVHKDRKTEQEVFLIPEFCQMTGLSDAQRNNFNLMKELSTITKKNASARLLETASLIFDLEKNEHTREIIKNWQIDLEKVPVGFPFRRYQAGNLLLSKQNNSQNRVQLSIENDSNLDRNSQQAMHTQPGLASWVIFYQDKDYTVFQEFLKTIQQCIQTYQYPVQKPREVEVKGWKFDDWRFQLQNLNPSFQMAVIILQGPKKNAPLYSPIKEYLLKEKGVASQVALVKTLQGKGLRSICNKILVQICAKVGGVPWAVDALPFTDLPTMICGIDVYHKTGKVKKSVFAFCATMDNQFSRYFSDTQFQSPGQEIGLYVENCITKALEEFKATNSTYPQRIIVYRDGISDSQRQAVESLEVSAIRQAISKTNNPMKLIFICINKQINAKFYASQATSQDNLKNTLNQLQNPQPGTVIQEPICSKKDFYLISQKTQQGIPTPSHYYVLINDMETENQDSNKKIIDSLQLLSYKLCYLYYNWLGSVKIPAPVQYAHRLSNLIGDRWDTSFTLKKELYSKKSLYFI